MFKYQRWHIVSTQYRVGPLILVTVSGFWE